MSMTPIHRDDLDVVANAIRHRSFEAMCEYLANCPDMMAVARLCVLYGVDPALPAWHYELGLHMKRLQKLTCLL